MKSVSKKLLFLLQGDPAVSQNLGEFKCQFLSLHVQSTDSTPGESRFGNHAKPDAPNLEAVGGVRVSKQKCQIPTAQTGSQAL